MRLLVNFVYTITGWKNKMQIRQLIEATLYRMDDRWRDDPNTPVIRGTGRESRTSIASTSYDVYVFTYACELNGIDCPRRWKSTFCTTDPCESSFLCLPDQHKLSKYPEIRQIVPASNKLAYVADDFNMSNFQRNVRRISSKVDSIARLLHIDGVYDEQLLSKFKSRNLEQTDGLYEQFKQGLLQLDRLAREHQHVDSIIELIKQEFSEVLSDRSEFGVVSSVEAIPDGNFEVWFEGEYEAHIPK